MDDRKKQLKMQWRAEQRKLAREAFPLPIAELKAMFDAVDVALGKEPCDHSRGIAQAWLESRGHAIKPVFAWLDEHGGFCDCEILNVEEHVEDAIADVP